MNEILNDFLEVIQTINSMKMFYLITPSMPTEMEFDGIMKPAIVIMPATVTYLDQDLLVIHPNQEQEVLKQIGHMLKPVTKNDWLEANKRAIAHPDFLKIGDGP